jgi:Amt family ammonium transporter
MNRVLKKQWDPSIVCNGILSGLVSITAGCSVTYTWHALLIGMIGSMFYQVTSYLMLKSKIDDPLDAFAVHGVAGMWGVLSTGLFAVPSYSYNGSCGVFFGCNETFGAACASISLQVLWVSLWSVLIFMSLKKLSMLRISKEEELRGLDVSKHGGSAYS